MPRFAANLSMMFTEVPFLERFAAAAGTGFEAVEYLFPYEHPPEALAERLAAHGLRQVLFNLPPGDWEAGERGLASLPGRESEFQDSVGLALEYAAALECPTLHVMAGIPPEGERETAWDTYVRNLHFAASAAAEVGRSVVIEPINTRDIPGFLLSYQRDAAWAIEAVALPGLGLQLDLYHCQIMEGDLATHLERYLPLARHVQIAGVPERHEPDVGEVNYFYLFERLDALGYEGWVGCEYRPRGDTVAGLGWLERARAPA